MNNQQQPKNYVPPDQPISSAGLLARLAPSGSRGVVCVAIGAGLAVNAVNGGGL